MVGNLWRIWGTVQQDVGELCDGCFRFLTMPHDILGKPSNSLDLTRADMGRLFDRGFAIGKALGSTEQWMTNPSEVAPRLPRP
jgi:hypothetical protein